MKRLVVCFDGTWNEADGDKAETNVARIARSIHASHDTGGVSQVVLYLRGVGSTGLQLERLIDGATGLGIDDNIRSAYMFLCQNYIASTDATDGIADEIYLFGFSRGAFTARSVGGLIGSCGLLHRQDLGDMAKAWQYYRNARDRSPLNFKQVTECECHTNVEIKFLGVWETVGALGLPNHLLGSIAQDDYSFHNTSPSPIVKFGYQALAIDEARDEFVPTLWTGAIPPGSVIEQVWFAGAHSDVGGGYVDRALADIPLVWMAEKAEQCGLALDWSVLPDRIALDPLAPRHESRVGWAAKDRLTPTFRRVLEKTFPVMPWETMYVPMDENGAILRTINESIHESVKNRYSRDALFSEDDCNKITVNEVYTPRNLVPPVI